MIETDDVVAIRGEDPDSKWTVQAVGIELGTHKQRWARLVQVDPHGFPRFRRVECDSLTVLQTAESRSDDVVNRSMDREA